MSESNTAPVVKPGMPREIKLTNEKLELFIHSLRHLMQTPLPMNISYRVGQLASRIDPVFQDFMKVRAEIVKKYGVPAQEKNPDGSLKVDDDGEPVMSQDNYEIAPTSANFEKFKSEFDALLGEENSFSYFKPIKLSVLDGVKISPANMMPLMMLFEIDEDDIEPAG